MKRLLTIASICLVVHFASCTTRIYYSIGMSQNDFLNNNKKKGLMTVLATKESAVYQFGFNPATLFYFNNGILDEVKAVQ